MTNIFLKSGITKASRYSHKENGLVVYYNVEYKLIIPSRNPSVRYFFK